MATKPETPKNADKNLEDSSSPTTNISLIGSGSGTGYTPNLLGTAAGAVELPSSISGPPPIPQKPPVLPRRPGAFSSANQQLHTGNTSTSSNTPGERPKLALIGQFGHPARLGGPSRPMNSRSQGPVPWHGLSGSRM